ncbi:MAG: hypothetical protein DDT42_02046 [candidate division WS2 bacterium]|uniref:Uncharacterized protein n=1 Tax=Psychracetigena formicireducens TaxID=2986056 RepID=A0A9E2BIX1_PSYF1|nr:hypothetical protein [Candidatus Psychracetigena formicireducens]
MRAYNTAVQPIEAVQPPTNNAKPVNGNEQQVRDNFTLGLWGGLLVIYIIWDFIVLGNKSLEKSLSATNIRTNLYNLVVIGIASMLFLNIGKVIVVKLAAWNIPVISWLAEEITPLFEL